MTSPRRIMHSSHVIEVDGVFVGAAITSGNMLRFVAVDVRLDELDGTVWPTLSALRAAVRCERLQHSNTGSRSQSRRARDAEAAGKP